MTEHADVAVAAPELDPVVHAPHRLRICAMLHAAREVEFGAIQRELDVSASVVSKQLAHLTGAGYVEQRRVLTGSRHRVWLRLTPAGKVAYRRHIAALRAILEAGAEAGDDD